MDNDNTTDPESIMGLHDRMDRLLRAQDEQARARAEEKKKSAGFLGWLFSWGDE